MFHRSQAQKDPLVLFMFQELSLAQSVKGVGVHPCHQNFESSLARIWVPISSRLHQFLPAYKHWSIQQPKGLLSQGQFHLQYCALLLLKFVQLQSSSLTLVRFDCYGSLKIPEIESTEPKKAFLCYCPSPWQKNLMYRCPHFISNTIVTRLK